VQRIHGLVIDASVALPGIELVQSTQPDLIIRVVDHLAEPRPPFTVRYGVETTSSEAPGVRITSDAHGQIWFRYGDGTAFDVDLSSSPTAIAVVIAPGQTLEDMCAYLYGPVLGYVLRARGILAMHASCVTIEGRAVLFGGAPGAGKSTTAAALVQRGARPVSDDLTALTPRDGGFIAHRAFDHFRLWTQSEPLLFGRSDVLERITPGWDKRRFPVRHDEDASAIYPASVIYLLDWAEEETLSIEALRGGDAFVPLTTITYANYLLDTAQRSTELVQLGALMACCPVRRFTRGPAHSMDEICDYVRRDVLRLSSTPSV
jgi:hypothetical protein